MIRTLCLFFATVVATAVALPASAAITYVSSTRFIETSGNVSVPGQRIDALGFNDFDQSITTLSPGPILGQRLSSASQTSRLLPDRIEARCWAMTGFLGGDPPGNFVSANSFLRVEFSVSEATPYSVYSGGVSDTTLGGGAGFGLWNTSTGDFIHTSSGFGARSGLLAPGSYTFQVQATAGSQAGRTGTASTVATLVLPSPSGIVLISSAVMPTLAIRRRNMGSVKYYLQREVRGTLVAGNVEPRTVSSKASDRDV